VKFNDKLSKARSESGKKVVAKLLKDSGLDIDAAAYGEDWDGFKELVEKSNIKDKNLILQVLSLYNSPAERETEIKNMSSVFEELKEEILPELRRSQIVNTTDLQGKTDEEIMAAYRNGGELSPEEYLFAAQVLVENPEEQIAILTTASKKYNDARIWNNLGVAQTKAGDKEAALKSFEKAAKLDSSAALNKNLLLANLANCNTAEAKKYAAAADSEAKAAMAAAEGNYKSAAAGLEGYNKAIALVQSNDLAGAKKAIAKEDCVYMVEGYTDVISMHQCGIENVVANSGTALSIHQIRLLHRFTSNIVLLYDGDAAGVHAALRGTDMLLEEEMNVKVLLLPEGDDPDSFARNHTAADFRKYIEENQKDFIQFKTDLSLNGVTDPVKRSQAINSIVESISKIKNQITRASYITDCSHRLGVNEAVIINALNSFIRNGMSEQVKEERRAAGFRDAGYPVKQQALRQAAVTPLDKLMEVEDLLIKLVIHHGDEIIKVQDADGNDVELPAAQYIYLDMEGDDFKFHHSIYNQIMAEAMEHIEEEGFRCETYFAAHPNPEISRIAGIPTGEQEITTASLQMKMNEEKLRQQIFKDMLSFRTHYIAQRIIEVQQEFKQNPGNRELLEEFVKLKKMNMLVASQSNNVFN